MIKITRKVDCCGCYACGNVCSKKAISFKADKEGFWYPEVDVEKCVECGLCEKVCPVLHQKEEIKPIEVKAAININEKVRINSSSGGVFSILAENTIQQGGVVFGAQFNSNWEVVITPAETLEQVASFRGSKYLQARIGDSYIKCKEFLLTGRQVLFSGTPCQIAGLHNFLRRDFDNLITVDFVCHGVPSPGVWLKYLEEKLGSSKSNIIRINFRAKPEGWKKFHLEIEAGKEFSKLNLSSWHRTDPYMKAFLGNMILRPSCYFCPAKCGKSHSDLGMADFWGVEEVFSEMDDDKGTSIVLVNTPKGKTAMENGKMICKEVEYDTIVQLNPSITRSSVLHRQRSRFFSKWQKTDNLVSLIEACLKPSLFYRLCALLIPQRL